MHTPTRRTTRNITVRYYKTARPGQAYPLLVVVSPRIISDDQLDRRSRQEPPVQVEVSTDRPIEVDPVFPNADVYPTDQTVPISPDAQPLRFEVVAKRHGPLSGARVLVRQNGVDLAKVDLEITVRRDYWALFLGAAAVFLSVFLKLTHLDVEHAANDGLSGWRSAAAWVSDAVPWWAAGLVLAAAALAVWYWRRPRPTTFWVVTQRPGPDPESPRRLAEAEAAFDRGDATAGIAFLSALLTDDPGFQGAWFRAGAWYFKQRQEPVALKHFEEGLKLGPAPAWVYAQAARCVATAEQPAQAVEWLDMGLAAAPDPRLAANMRFNKACYLVRMGELDRAATVLKDAVNAGNVDRGQLMTDPDLAPLRHRDDVRDLFGTAQTS